MNRFISQVSCFVGIRFDLIRGILEVIRSRNVSLDSFCGECRFGDKMYNEIAIKYGTYTQKHHYY